jgi:hypothetical protein
MAAAWSLASTTLGAFERSPASKASSKELRSASVEKGCALAAFGAAAGCGLETGSTAADAADGAGAGDEEGAAVGAAAAGDDGALRELGAFGARTLAGAAVDASGATEASGLGAAGCATAAVGAVGASARFSQEANRSNCRANSMASSGRSRLAPRDGDLSCDLNRGRIDATICPFSADRKRSEDGSALGRPSALRFAILFE